MKKFLLLAITVISFIVLVACAPDENASGKDLNKYYCDGCHGDEIKNGGYSKSEILDTIKDGAQGMDANIIKGKKAEKVAEYLSNK